MAEARITFHPGRRGAGSVGLTETHWGYILREAGGTTDDALLIGAALRYLGVVCAVAALAQWLLPWSAFPNVAFTGRVWISLILLLSGLALCGFGGRRGAAETQVDLANREFRFAWRGGRGRVKVLRRVPFATVESVFVDRHDGALAEVLLRLRGTDATLRLARGDGRDLDLLHQRLCRDMKSPAERIEARLRVVPPRKVAVRVRTLKTA